MLALALPPAVDGLDGIAAAAAGERGTPDELGVEDDSSTVDPTRLC